MTHVLQIRKEGFFQFYLCYLAALVAGMWRNKDLLETKPFKRGLVSCFWQGYWEIPYEVEARSNEDEELTQEEYEELDLQDNLDLVVKDARDNA